MKFNVPKLLIILLLIASCKKENTTSPQINLDANVVGTYHMSSFAQKGGVPTLALDANAFPCLTNNIAIYKADHTSTGYYSGSTPCQVAPGTFIGMPGDDTVRNVWQLHGNVLVVRRQSGTLNLRDNITISVENGKNKITELDTIPMQSSSPGIYTIIYVQK